MGRTRNIAKNVKVETAVGPRRCHAKKTHIIKPGQKHVAVYEGGHRQNLCMRCAEAILNTALDHITGIRRVLYGH